MDISNFYLSGDMLPKEAKRRANRVIDFFHKGAVLTCVGVTVLGTGVLIARFYHYMTVTRPLYLELQKKQLLNEGSSNNIKDSAKDLSIL